MKTRHFFRAAMVVVCGMAMTFFMGCKGWYNTPSDDTKTTDPAEDTKPVSALTHFSFATNDQMVDLFYITFEYYDAYGTVQSFTMKRSEEATWGQDVNTTKFPAKVGVRVSMKMRGDADRSKYKSIHIDYTMSYTSIGKNAAGRSVGDYYKNAISQETDVALNKVNEWLDSYAKNPIVFVLEYDEKGIAKETNKW